MNDNFECGHERQEKNANYNYCLKCGCTIIGSVIIFFY